MKWGAIVLTILLPGSSLATQVSSQSLRDRASESEPSDAVWESTITIGPALIHWKVFDERWEESAHCVAIVFDAPGVVSASYRIERVYADKVVTGHGARDDLFLLAPTRFMQQVEVAMTTSNLKTSAGLGEELVRDCYTDQTKGRTRPSEVRVLVTSVEMDDGRAFGDDQALARWREGLVQFRRALLYLDEISRQASTLKGSAGFQKFRETLSTKTADERFVFFPPLQQFLKDWMEGIRIGHPHLIATPENFLPQLQDEIRRSISRVDGQLASTNPESRLPNR